MCWSLTGLLTGLNTSHPHCPLQNRVRLPLLRHPRQSHQVRGHPVFLRRSLLPAPLQVHRLSLLRQIFSPPRYAQDPSFLIYVCRFFRSVPFLSLHYNISAAFAMTIYGMTGVTVAQASTPSFTDAIIGTVSQALGTSPKTVSGVIITTSGTAAAPDVGMIYAVNVTSGITTKVLLGRLDTSIVSGKFLKSLSEKSGVNISSVSGLVLLNTSPTISPTPSTVQGSSGEKLP